MTQEELLTLFANRLMKSTVLSWSDFVSAVNSSGQNERDTILLLINENKYEELGKRLVDIAQKKKHSISRAQIDTYAQNGNFSIAELLAILQ